MTTYDPAFSAANNERLQAFARSTLTKSLTQVPGLGTDDACEQLVAIGIETPHQLLGVFLSYQHKVPLDTSQALSGSHCGTKMCIPLWIHMPHEFAG
jgi:hypothetical protein